MFVKKINGFTIVETLVAFLCAVIVIVGTVATLTVSTKFANLEKAETVAQNIAKNIMTQQIKNNSFVNVKANLVQTQPMTLFDSRYPNNTSLLGTSSTLARDLKLLGNSQCKLKLTPLDAGPKQINAKVEILWGLNSDASINQKTTRKFEISSIIYEYNYNDTSKKREKLVAKVDLNVLPGGTTPNPCSVTTNKPDECNCSLNSECSSNNCLGGVCKPLVALLPNGSVCSTGTQCQSGSCVAGLCASVPVLKANGESCTLGVQCISGNCLSNVCRNNPQPLNSSCAVNGECQSGLCSSGNLCKLPNDASCSSAGDCNSGKCTGSPKKCKA